MFCLDALRAQGAVAWAICKSDNSVMVLVREEDRARAWERDTGSPAIPLYRLPEPEKGP
jgi:hypothetical protein